MISIIVPVYKVAPYLRQCVDSIRKQTVDDLEIILVDDGSPDECGEICDEYAKIDSRVRVFHTEHRGLSAARNIGLDNAKGEYLGFVDSDDWIEVDMYEMLWKSLLNTNADISICSYLCESVNTQKECIYGENIYSGIEMRRALFEGKINNNVWNKLYHRELFQELRFPEGMNYEDIATMHRIIERARSVAVINESKYHYRIRDKSITKAYTAKNILDYADAHLFRYGYFNDNKFDQFTNEETLMIAAKGLSKVWRWWYGCSKDDKEVNQPRIKELNQFVIAQFPLFGYRSWPINLRLSTFFMHSTSGLSFYVLYKMNQGYRRIILKRRLPYNSYK